MKMFMKILVSSFIIVSLLGMIPFESTCAKLEQDVLRLHIIANSDSDFDQELKLKVRDAVLKNTSSLYDDVNSKEEAEKITRDNIEMISKTASNTIRQHGYDYEINASVTKKFFDTRYYDNFTMPAGVYDTVVITIGQGKGKNWWCVMYPTLCVGASSKISMRDDLSDDEYNVITADDVVYKFKIVEYFEKISSIFN